MKTPQKLALALSFAFGVTVPLVAMAQITPTTPKTPNMTAPTLNPSVTPTVSPSVAPLGGPSMSPMPAETSPTMTPSPTGSPLPKRTSTPSKTSAPTSSKTKMTKPIAAKVNINSATMAQLVKINGIGPATAKKIMTGRPYANLDELVSKKVMQPKQFAAVKTQLTAP